MSSEREMSLKLKEYLDSKDTIPDFHRIKKEYRGLLDETSRLRQRVAELEKKVAIGHTIEREIYQDAERYRWLKEKMTCRMPGGFGYTLAISWSAETNVDAIIDAAMETGDPL